MENNEEKGSSFYKIMTIAIFSSIIIGGALSKKDSNDYKEQGLFEPGEHVVRVPVDDITKEITVYEGHDGYKPMGINIYSLSEENSDSGTMIFVNTTEVKVESTGTDEYGNKIYEDFGIPVNYNVEFDENEYDIGQHIITVPCDYDNTLNIEYYDGYNIAGIVRTSISDNNEKDGCILYVNNEPVEYVYSEDNNSYFGTPIEKGKVLEK
jgi:hypothetical protein